MASRLIEALVPEAQRMYKLFEGKCREKHINFMITCTYRSQQEQDDLYAQGRTGPGRIVTWTRNSIHSKGEAWDIAIVKEGTKTPLWNVKVDLDMDDIPDYEEAAQVGRELGLIVGADFKNAKGLPRPDYPHYQLK